MSKSPEHELESVGFFPIIVEISKRTFTVISLLLLLASVYSALNPENKDLIPPNLMTFDHPSIRFTEGDKTNGLSIDWPLPLTDKLKMLSAMKFNTSIESYLPDQDGNQKTVGSFTAFFGPGQPAEVCTFQIFVPSSFKKIDSTIECLSDNGSGNPRAVIVSGATGWLCYL